MANDAGTGARDRWQAKVTDAAKAARGRTPMPYAVLLRHGTLEVGMYVPGDEDRQTPHDRDELYIVASGSGVFVRDGERIACATGDMLFVPAGMAHHFEGYSDGFATWVVFYGPQGGEGPHPQPPLPR